MSYEISFASNAKLSLTTTIIGEAANLTNMYMSMLGGFESANEVEEDKPTSVNQMQKQAERNQAPKEIDRVDHPHNIDIEKPHIHFKNYESALNNDGTWHHEGRKIPKITNKIKQWLLKNGWKLPLE